MTFKDNLTSANVWLTDNLLIVGIAILLLIIGFYYSKAGNSRKRSLGLATLSIGGFSLIWVIIALFYLLSAGTTIVLGHWAIYGDEPEGTLQLALVGWVFILITVTAFGGIGAVMDDVSKKRK